MRFPVVVAALVGILLSGCTEDYANDYSNSECVTLRAMATQSADDNAEYTVHCCSGEDDDGNVVGCRG
jgi:hypothetical protein